MDELTALPVGVPLVGAAVSLLALRSVVFQRTVAAFASFALFAAAVALLLAVSTSGSLELQIGGWKEPFGIRLRADVFSALMVLITAIIGCAVVVYSFADIPRSLLHIGFYPLTFLLLMGVCGAFLTADIFNLYVWFELMLMASFVLLSLGGRRDQLRGGVVYVTLNLLSSALLLIGVALVYSMVRTLDFDSVADRMALLGDSQPYLVGALQGIFLTSFGLKAGLFPLFFWLPASYHTPPPSVSALFAGLLTKVGLYALIRTTASVFPGREEIHLALVVISCATMIVGVLGALAQNTLRRILSFHIISQIGYMTAGLALANPANPSRVFALAAGIFYIIHHIIVKTNLFLVAGIVRRLKGTEHLDRLGGLALVRPGFSILFLVPALSLAGMPPLSGFWAKLAIIRAGLVSQQYVLVAAAVLAGLLTLTSMLKIWNGAFAKPSPTGTAAVGRREILLLTLPAASLAILTVAIGLNPELLFALASTAAEHLLASPEHLD